MLSYSKNNDLMLVLKDNAYGFGLLKVARLAYDLGIKKYAIRSISEAVSLRKKYSDAFILLLGIPPRNINALKKNKICVTISNLEDYYFFSDAGIDMHLELNLGMNRYGFDEISRDLFNDKHVTGVYFHTPSAIDAENEKYIDRFKEVVADYNLFFHIGGSVMLKQKTEFTLRIGHAIYKDALELYGKVTAIRKIKKQQTIGYDKRFIASNDCLVAIVDIGYVNGLTRFHNDRFCYIKKKNYSIVGNTCMDQTFVIVDKDIKVNDVVEFVGKHISLDDFAKMNEISTYQAYLMIK